MHASLLQGREPSQLTFTAGTNVPLDIPIDKGQMGITVIRYFVINDALVAGYRSGVGFSALSNFIMLRC
jgi:hypothetical protein